MEIEKDVLSYKTCAPAHKKKKKRKQQKQQQQTTNMFRSLDLIASRLLHPSSSQEAPADSSCLCITLTRNDGPPTISPCEYNHMCTICQIHHGTGPSPTASRRQRSQVDATDESPPSVQVVPYQNPVWTPTHATAVKKQRRNLVSTITSWTQSRHEVSRSYALGFRADPRCVLVIDLV